MSTEDTDSNKTSEQGETPQKRSGYNILIIDDDHFLLDMYCMKFSHDGHIVEPCSSVDEALSALRGGFAADAIVFDLIMPDKDGFALLRALKEEGLAKQAALIALTNQGADEERKKMDEFGVDGYIVKASTIPSAVVTTIVDIIKKKRGA